MDWKQLGKAAKRAAASIEDAARKAAPHIEEAAAKAAAHIEEAAAKAKPHLEDAARKTRAAAKEVGKRIDRAEPGRDAVKRLLGGVLKDWLDGEISWIDEDNESAAEAKTAGASIAVSLRKGEIELRRVKLKARSLDAVGAPVRASRGGFMLSRRFRDTTHTGALRHHGPQGRYGHVHFTRSVSSVGSR